MYKRQGLSSTPELNKLTCIEIRNDGVIYFAGKGTNYVFKYIHSKSIFYIDVTQTSLKGILFLLKIYLIKKSKRTQKSYKRYIFFKIN